MFTRPKPIDPFHIDRIKLYFEEELLLLLLPIPLFDELLFPELALGFDVLFWELAFPFEEDFFGGTFAPDSRASLSAMATACFRFFTLPPFPPLPDFNVPCLYSCITSPTFSCAFFEYFAIILIFFYTNFKKRSVSSVTEKRKKLTQLLWTCEGNKKGRPNGLSCIFLPGYCLSEYLYCTGTCLLFRIFTWIDVFNHIHVNAFSHFGSVFLTIPHGSKII